MGESRMRFARDCLFTRADSTTHTYTQCKTIDMQCIMFTMDKVGTDCVEE